MTSYNKVAKLYSDSMSEKGDYYHRTQNDPYVYKLVGKLKGNVVYDIGCGNGYMARKFFQKGATVFASDVSEKLIKIAESKSKGMEIHYSINDATDFRLIKPNSIDVVVMSMVIHYVADLDKLFKGISSVLRKNGKLVFSNHHFLRSNYPYSEWVKGEINGKEKLFIKLTDYLLSNKIKTSCWLDDDMELEVYDYPLNVIVNKLAKNGLYITRVEEPESIGFAKDFPKHLRNSHHIPTFIIIQAKKL